MRKHMVRMLIVMVVVAGLNGVKIRRKRAVDSLETSLSPLLQRPCILNFTPFVAGFQVACAQETGWGLHKRMFGVPTPGKVAIDGKLNDWDMSGALTVHVVVAKR